MARDRNGLKLVSATILACCAVAAGAVGVPGVEVAVPPLAAGVGAAALSAGVGGAGEAGSDAPGVAIAGDPSSGAGSVGPGVRDTAGEGPTEGSASPLPAKRSPNASARKTAQTNRTMNTATMRATHHLLTGSST